MGIDVHLRRAYESAAASDGYRVLVDRLWPRGVSHERAKLDAWEKELAPSTELRKWFGHEHSEHNDAVVLAEIVPRGLPKTHRS